MAAITTRELLPCVQLITTGGTIAMKVDRSIGAPVPTLTGGDLLRTISGLAGVAAVEVTDLFNVPSVEMDPMRLRALRAAVGTALERSDLDGVIVSHGTDTLEESAWFLDLTLLTDKPVVLVGAQRNASEPDFDGPYNLLCAARVCASPEARGYGVMVVMNGQIHAARTVTKWHTTDVAGFRSRSEGALGSVDPERVVMSLPASPARPWFGPGLRQEPARVEIVTAFGGACGWQIRAAVEQGARGIVIQALGAGNITQAMQREVEVAIRQGVRVVVATRVPNGVVRPIYGFIGGGKALQQAGVVFAHDLSAQKARILLMLAIEQGSDKDEIQRLFDS